MVLLTHKQEWSWGTDWFVMTSDEYGMVRLSLFEGEYSISNLYVDEAHRNQGYATCLLDRCDEIVGSNNVINVRVESKELAEWFLRRDYCVEIDEKYLADQSC